MAVPAATVEQLVDWEVPEQQIGLWSDAFQRFRRNRIALLGAVLIAVLVVIALTCPLLVQLHLIRDPLQQNVDFIESGPGQNGFLIGSDELGRDTFARLLFGSRVSLAVGIFVQAIILPIGLAIGLAAGYFGGVVDGVVMRLTDLVFAFPAIILAMVVTASLGPSIRNAVLALVFVSWPTYARVVRGLVLATADSEYVQASRLLGTSARSALFRVVLPNVIGPVIVLATLDLGNAILLLSGLSFLGLGAQPPAPEWGQMVSQGTENFQYWWLSTFPGLAIFTAVLAFNFVGDSLRDVFDPRTSGGGRV